MRLYVVATINLARVCAVFRSRASSETKLFLTQHYQHDLYDDDDVLRVHVPNYSVLGYIFLGAALYAIV